VACLAPIASALGDESWHTEHDISEVAIGDEQQCKGDCDMLGESGGMFGQLLVSHYAHTHTHTHTHTQTHHTLYTHTRTHAHTHTHQTTCNMPQAVYFLRNIT